jgi:hypothetical protein
MSQKRATILNTLPKPALIGIMLVCLAGIFLMQGQLNTQRGRLSPSYIEPLQDAPPMLALATETLAGFRGIISSYLWQRANQMQLDKNYPEQMQLAKWITQLQPHVPAAWVNRSWNMAYNISRTYPDPGSRWKYVYDAVVMLRDEGILYNPQEPLVYDQLAYLFEHKIGHNLDDHHRYYKYMWMQRMENVLWESPAAGHAAQGVPDFDSLINPDPANTNLVKRAQRLRREYKLDPREMKAIHLKYGLARKLAYNDQEKKWEVKELMLDKDGQPINCLDWRMPETHSLYWATLGLKRCSLTPGREKVVFKLEKKVYVAMMYTFQRGRMNTASGETIPPEAYFSGEMLSAPNLDSAGTVHLAYLDMIQLAQASRENHLTGGTSEIGHNHFLRRVIEWLYFYNREAEAREWLEMAIELYPVKMTFWPGYDPKTKTYNLKDIVFDKAKDDLERGSDSKTQALLIGVFMKHFFALAEGDEKNADEYYNMAQQAHQHYSEKFKNSPGRMGIAPFDVWRIVRLRAFLIEQDPAVADALRVKLGLGKDELPEIPQPHGPAPDPGSGR